MATILGITMISTFVFNAVTGGVLSFPSGISSPFSFLGYQGRDIPEEYMVTITDKLPDLYKKETIVRIRAPLQEKIGTRTESEWSPLSSASALSSILPTQELSQVISGHSTVSRYASRRIWTGGGALDFTLNLKFEAQENVSIEVLKPLIELQRMSLPYSGNGSITPQIKSGSTGEFLRSLYDNAKTLLKESFLYPPGPSPFGDAAAQGAGEHIIVKLGKFMIIEDVVIKDIGIEVPVRFVEGGAPVGAIVNVHFQTFEMLTKERLDGLYTNINRTTSNSGGVSL
jgi:hypothetical protein